tara:strand:+ start:1846 stop:1962 length:117 start_codon:yes stop_codon:yes gene_type:complete
VLGEDVVLVVGILRQKPKCSWRRAKEIGDRDERGETAL